MDEPFVGRAAELAELDRQFGLAEGGHGRAVLLTGPAGIGKTALIRRCLTAWATHADTVLACGDQEEADLSGGLLGQLAQESAGAASEIGAVLASGQADPLTAGSALLTLVQELAATAPLVLVIDDAQWGDELSLKAVSFALRRLTGRPGARRDRRQVRRPGPAAAWPDAAGRRPRRAAGAGRPDRRRGGRPGRAGRRGAAARPGRYAAARAHRRCSAAHPRAPARPARRRAAGPRY